MKVIAQSRIARLLSILIVLQLFGPALDLATAQNKSRKPKIVYYSIAANRALRVRLNQKLDSEQARIGDTFTSTVVDPVYSKNGVLLIPQGSIVNGRVTNVQRAQKNGKPATLDVQFYSLKLPNGRSVALNGSLFDLASAGGKSDNEGTVTAKTTSKRNLKFIGGGAAGGAVIGAIAGGGKGLLIGGAVGAVTGLVAKKLKKGHEVKVDSGTEFGVMLNRAISLPKYGGV